jgi:kynurenine formamidase
MTRTLAAPAASLIVALAVLAGAHPSAAQTREKGPWWPSPHGAADQAGAANYITPEKVVKAMQLVKTGRIYELGFIYEASMPQYGDRPYYLNVTPAARPQRDGGLIAHQDYFTGFLGQMGTQFDALGHQGTAVKMADGSVQWVFYNGFTENDLTGANGGAGGLRALGVEQAKPIITRGILVDVAGFKGVPVLDSRYEVTLADVRGALARQNIAERSIEPGDAILFNYGWAAANWTNPSKYNDSRFGVGENKGSPGIGPEVARWLSERKVSMVGADSCCVQVMPALKPDTLSPHLELFLKEGIYLLENMNLQELARDRAYEFLLISPPLRIKGATGSPVRPLAIR